RGGAGSPGVAPDEAIANTLASRQNAKPLGGRRLAWQKTVSISLPSMVVSWEEVSMHTITITLSDDRLAKLQEMAARLHISPEELARAGVEELLARPEETCHRAIDYVLKKNAELYRRLA